MNIPNSPATGLQAAVERGQRASFKFQPGSGQMAATTSVQDGPDRDASVQRHSVFHCLGCSPKQGCQVSKQPNFFLHVVY